LTWAFGPPAHDENQIEHSGISLHPKAHITANIFRRATGKLFDASGARLTPSHALKGERRYRYYVSLRLAKGPAQRVQDGLAAARFGARADRG
jgi:hypothetical protein